LRQKAHRFWRSPNISPCQGRSQPHGNQSFSRDCQNKHLSNHPYERTHNPSCHPGLIPHRYRTFQELPWAHTVLHCVMDKCEPETTDQGCCASSSWLLPLAAFRFLTQKMIRQLTGTMIITATLQPAGIRLRSRYFERCSRLYEDTP